MLVRDQAIVRRQRELWTVGRQRELVADPGHNDAPAAVEPDQLNGPRPVSGNASSDHDTGSVRKPLRARLEVRPVCRALRPRDHARPAGCRRHDLKRRSESVLAALRFHVAEIRHGTPVRRQGRQRSRRHQPVPARRHVEEADAVPLEQQRSAVWSPLHSPARAHAEPKRAVVHPHVAVVVALVGESPPVGRPRRRDTRPKLFDLPVIHDVERNRICRKSQFRATVTVQQAVREDEDEHDRSHDDEDE